MGIKAMLFKGVRFYDVTAEEVSPVAPEIGLIIAVIQRAIYDYCESHGSAVSGIKVYQQSLRETLKGDAERWLFADDWEPFSFNWCCEAIGISPDAVRGELFRTARPEMIARLHLKRIIRHGEPRRPRKGRLCYDGAAVQIH